MEANLKKILRSVSLELRHILEGRYDDQGHFHSGDLERRLNEIGIWRDRSAKPIGEMPHLSDEDKSARKVIDAYILFRNEAGVSLADAFTEFVRESAYTWANRLFALRCMEARAIIDEVILQKDTYGGRSLVHHRFARKNPEECSGEDDGLFAVLIDEFAVRAEELPTLFDPKSPAVALRPSVAALKQSIAFLSGREILRGQEPACDDVFSAPDAFGWAYQYWNAEEKDRVFEMVRTQKGAKIEGADIIPATQLYTEPYMVKFLVQNSLGAIWMGMHPDSRLYERWEYYVNDVDRSPVELKPLQKITFLDPAVGSGHFLLEGFDLFYSMYEEEGQLQTPEQICTAILNNNLFGIDIDGRAVQIATTALWMKAKEKASDLKASGISGFREHLVATNIRLPKNKDHLDIFLKKHPEDEPLLKALETVLHGLENAHELGSLLQIEEPVERVFKELKQKDELEKAQQFKKDQGEFWNYAPQAVLPLNAEDWMLWKKRTLDRLKIHFSEEAENSNLGDSFFGNSAKTGFLLFDLLAQRYDIVAANPPYASLSRLSEGLRSKLSAVSLDKIPDIFAAFISIFKSKLAVNGYLSFLTLHSWMFLSTFKSVREELLDDMVINILIHLGTGTMKDLSNPNAQGFCMFIAQNTNADIDSYFVDCTSFSDKNSSLLSNIINNNNTFKMNQNSFKIIEGSPLAYWIPDDILGVIKKCSTLIEHADVRQGFATADNNRFLRFNWEVPSARWIRYSKGGKYYRFSGNETYTIDWEFNGVRLKNLINPNGRPKAVLRNPRYLGKIGVTWTALTTYAFSARLMRKGSGFDATGPALFPHDPDDIYLWLAFCNSRWVAFSLKALNPTITFREGYVSKIPVPVFTNKSELSKLGEVGYKVRQLRCSYNINEAQFVYKSNMKTLNESIKLRTENELILDTIVSILLKRIDDIVINDLAVNTHDKIKAIFEGSGGIPPHYSPLLSCYKEMPHDILINLNGYGVGAELINNIDVTDERDIDKTRIYLKSLFGKGFAGIPEGELDNDDNINDSDSYEPDLSSSSIRPIESFIEQLAISTDINPISIYSLIKDGIANDNWRCIPEEQRITSDLISVLILRLLGHRWPMQIEANESVPGWADEDGIIPLTLDCGENTLLGRVRERIAEEFPCGIVNAIEQEFAQIIGTSLDKWLVGPFFKRHISQFNKRPIAWQIQSSPSMTSGGRGKASRSTGDGPAFSALIYYQKLGYTTILDIRKLYVDKLRISYETELRTLEGNLQPTPEQSSRKIRLEGWIEELNVFDKKLEGIAREAFGPVKMRPVLRQYAIDDAMLSLVACWLKRLSKTVQSGPLKTWEEAAEKTKLHQDFPQWVHNATARLDHFCSAVGPKAPEEKKLVVDPTPAGLAPIISSHAAIMVKDSIAKACDSWWKEFDAAVLLPLRQKISETDDKVKLLEEERDSTDCTTTRKIEIERLLKQLKADIKGLKKELSEKTEKAKTVRREMEAWRCKEAGLWEGWLATQPPFDKFTQLDATKAAPTTIAEFIIQESAYYPDINDGVRVNIAPLQKAGLLAADVIAAKDLDKAISDRADWRADERRWCREGKLPQPGWWKAEVTL